MDVPVKAVEKVAHGDGIVHMSGEVSVLVDLGEFSTFELKEGAPTLVTGRDEDLVPLDDWGGRVRAVTGFPFFKGKGLAVFSVQNNEPVGFQNGNEIRVSCLEGSRGAVGCSVDLAFPLCLARFLVEGEGSARLDESVVEVPQIRE